MTLPLKDTATDAPDARDNPDYGPLNDRLGYWLRRAQIAVFQDFFERFRAYDIRPAQYSALTIIERNPGLSQTAVGDALGIQKANFVVMIGELERRGLARREKDKRDRRGYCLYLTSQGEVLMAELHKVSELHEDRIRSRIGGIAYAAIRTSLRELAHLDGGQK